MAWLAFHRKPSTPDRTMVALIKALKSRDQTPVRALTTNRGFADLKQAAEGYVKKGKALGAYLQSEHKIILKNGWQVVDSTHVSGGVSWKGGSGRHTDEISVVKLGEKWKLDRYVRIYDR